MYLGGVAVTLHMDWPRRRGGSGVAGGEEEAVVPAGGGAGRGGRQVEKEEEEVDHEHGLSAGLLSPPVVPALICRLPGFSCLRSFWELDRSGDELASWIVSSLSRSVPIDGSSSKERRGV